MPPSLNLIYRDGVSTPAWKERRGILPTLLSPFLPDVTPLVDLTAAVVFDLPDLFIGRMYSTVRAVLPDMRQNIRAMSQTLPVGSMLMGVDQRSEVRHLAAQEMPILTEWGCFDRITPGNTAQEFATIARSRSCGCPVATAGCWPGRRGRRTSSRISSRGKPSWRRWTTAGVSSPRASTRCAP